MNNWLTNNNEQIEYFVKSNDIILTGRKFQINLLLQLIEYYRKSEKGTFLDFGCGDGVVSRIILSKFPGCHIDLLDGSEVMIEKVKAAGMKNTDILQMTFSEWTDLNVENKYDLIFSSMAIHHLDSYEKSRLYAKLFNALKFGGLLVNMDVMKPASKKVEDFHFAMWDNSIAEQLENNPEELKKHENITSAYKNKPENKPSSLISQLQMLENAGFEDVDCHYKNGIFAMFSGVKN